MKTKNRLLATLLVSAMVLSFVGCDSKSDKDEKDEDTRSSRTESTDSRSTERAAIDTESNVGQKWNLGTVNKTGLDNGYTGEKIIDNGDPHYGCYNYFVKNVCQKRFNNLTGNGKFTWPIPI